MNTYELISVGFGGALGALARFKIAQIIILRTLRDDFPWGTLFINITGCFCIGLVIVCCRKYDNYPLIRLFLTTGFLGGFTTYSAFAIESFNLISRENLIYGIGYIALTVGLGLAAVAFGASVGTIATGQS